MWRRPLRMSQAEVLPSHAVLKTWWNEDDLSAWARQRCCPLTQSWKKVQNEDDLPLTTNTGEPNWALIGRSIHTHFWTLHQTKLCNWGIPLAQGKNMVSRAMTLQDEPDRGDVRILFYRHSLLQQLDVHIATLSKNINSQLSCTPWILTPLHISCTLCAIHHDQRSPWSMLRSTQADTAFWFIWQALLVVVVIKTCPLLQLYQFSTLFKLHRFWRLPISQ